jgi:hypothetical protein
MDARLTLLSACIVLGTACASDHPLERECEAAAVAAPLFGASTDPFELEAREQNAIVALTLNAQDAGQGLCTGVLIAPRRVLTARHCADLLPHGVSVFVGPSIDAYTFKTLVLDFESHEALDVAIAELEDAIPSDLAAPLEPISVREQLEVDMRVILAGYGLTEDDLVGVRLFVQEPIKEITSDTVVVDGGGETGACVGDSGGPLLMRDDDGRHRIIGVLSAGSASCLNIDVYQRLEALSAWLEPSGC